MVRPWDSLSDDEKALFSRMAEVYAGFSEYTDAQVGRIIDYLEESGQLDNTLDLLLRRQRRVGRGQPERLGQREQVLQRVARRPRREPRRCLDQLGGPEAYNHYPTGWAMAFSTPFRMFKRYSYQGGICDPMVIHWPKGIKAKGEVRNQYHHVHRHRADDPRVHAGIEFPEFVQGYEQTPLPGVSMKYSFDDEPDAPTHEGHAVLRDARHPRHLARGLEGGRGARADVGPRATSTRTSGSCSTPTRTGPRRTTWPRSTPRRWRSSCEVWFAEAGKYDVLPLDDRAPDGDPDGRAPVALRRRRGRYVFYPGTSDLPENAAAEPARPIVQASSPTSRSTTPRGGRAVGPRRAVRRPQRCSSRAGSSGT